MRRLAALVLLLLSTLPLAAGTLVKIGDLQIGRYLHTATLLPDGRILVAGDHTFVELVELRAGVATSTLTDTRTARFAYPTATLLPTGDVLLIGGANDWEEDVWGDSDVLAFRPGSTRLLAQLHDARMRHQATLLGDGRVLVTGGEMKRPDVRQLAFAAAEIVSADGTVRRISPMREPRTDHEAVRLQDGRVLIVGGNLNGLPSAELFDPATETFVSLPAPRWGREHHTLTLLQDGRVLVAGGGRNVEDYAEIFDPATNQFTTTTFNYPHDMHAAVLLHDGTVLLAGDREVVVYDPRRDAVVDRVPFGTNVHGEVIELTGMAATLLPDGSVLLTGGQQYAHWPYQVTDIWRYKSRPTPKRRAVGR